MTGVTSHVDKKLTKTWSAIRSCLNPPFQNVQLRIIAFPGSWTNLDRGHEGRTKSKYFGIFLEDVPMFLIVLLIYLITTEHQAIETFRWNKPFCYTFQLKYIFLLDGNFITCHGPVKGQTLVSWTRAWSGRAPWNRGNFVHQPASSKYWIFRGFLFFELISGIT